jgi:hypothetical protein
LNSTDGKDHSEEGLEDLIVGGVESTRDDVDPDLQRQVPDCECNNDCDQRGEEKNDRVLELLIERQ